MGAGFGFSISIIMSPDLMLYFEVRSSSGRSPRIRPLWISFCSVCGMLKRASIVVLRWATVGAAGREAV